MRKYGSMAISFLKVSIAGTLICLACVGTLIVQAQERPVVKKRFTNADVIEMVKMGFSEDIIIAKIRSARAAEPDFLSLDTSLDGLKALKEANVPDSVIKVMINPSPAPDANITTGPMASDPNLPPPEVGVYWKDGTRFTLVQGQTVTNTKAGGKAGSLFTNGMRNQHWDATIEGPVSKNVVKDRRPLFFIYVPDGSDSSDYLLISLNKKSDHREFQIGSFGGITGGKSGVKRDKELQFHADHMGIRIYKISLDSDLKPGEYAFFMGTGQGNTMAGAHGGNRSGGSASGRIYDFSIPQ
jgi:hypothetical protein